MDYGMASSNAMLSGVTGAVNTVVAGSVAAADTLPTPPTSGMPPNPNKVARQDKRAERKVKRVKARDERNYIEDATAMSAADSMYNDAIEMFENNA